MEESSNASSVLMFGVYNYRYFSYQADRQFVLKIVSPSIETIHKIAMRYPLAFDTTNQFVAEIKSKD